ncbi:MAG: hypothetical protein AB1668_05070 [Nanoarchaeota archaeon]
MDEDIAKVLHGIRGTRENQITKLRKWIRSKWDESEDSNQRFKEWLKRQEMLELIRTP